jgi:YidC/Oxa1 family membrane protein insertase
MKEQTRNILNFVLFSTIILAGWIWLQYQYRPEVDEKPDEQANQQDQQKKTPATTPAKKTPPVKREPYDALAVGFVGDRSGLDGSLPLTGLAFLYHDMPSLSPPEVVKKEKPKSPAKEEQTKTLGGPGFFLRVVVTDKGAGVRKLTLANFQDADWYGEPVYQTDADGNEITDADGNKIPVPLDLIPDDPYRTSYLMFHAEDPKAKNPIWRADLGLQTWDIVEINTSNPEQHSITFSTPGPKGYENLEIRKTFTLKPGDYHVGLTLQIKDIRTDPDTNAAPFRYQMAGPLGMPIEGVWHTYVYRTALIGRTHNTTGALWRDYSDSRMISFKKGGDRVPEGTLDEETLRYAAVVTRFFAAAIVVDEQPGDNFLAYARPTHESNEGPCRLEEVDEKNHKVKLTLWEGKDSYSATVPVTPYALKELDKKLDDGTLDIGQEIVVNLAPTLEGKEVAIGFRLGTQPKGFLEDITVRVASKPVDMKPGDDVVHQYLLYHGPVKVTQLYLQEGDKAVQDELVSRYVDTFKLDTLTDYRSEGWIGWFSKTIYWTDLLILTTKLMHWLLNFLYSIVRIEGLSIILLTVIVRGLMFPISRKQAMISMRMQELAPEMKVIAEKYKNDPMERQQAVMELYRKHKVNPIGGCLPLFLQLPFFLGLYYALQESTRFRLAEFLWIRNLAAPDMLFYWGQGFPLISDFDNMASGFWSFLYLGPYFNILPILAVIVMVVYQKYTLPPPTDEQQAMQQKMMKYMMFFIGLMFYKVAAGLSMYFIASSLWGMAERKLLPKKKTLPTPVPSPGGDGKKPPPTTAQGKQGKMGPGKGKAKGKGKGKEPEPEKPLQGLRDWWQEVLKQAKKK